MKKNIRIFAASLILGMLAGCTMQSFIQVTPRTDIPNGAKEILIRNLTIEGCASIFQQAGILYNRNESGLQTEEFLIDEGTRGRFDVTRFEGAVRVIPYWGITDRVRNQITFATAVATGYASNPYTSMEMKRVIYKKAEARPKMVFDYAVQLFSDHGISWK